MKQVWSEEAGPDAWITPLCDWIRSSVYSTLKKRGGVLGLSGGIDSAVVAALSVRALGSERVVALALPEKDSTPVSLELARALAEKLGIEFLVEEITAGLEGMGAYLRRDEAVQRIFPEYRPGMPFKITLQSTPLSNDRLHVFAITLVDDHGREQQKRLGPTEYAQIVAASNMKQRLRMTMLYYHAELRNYAVLGTGNKNEHMLGFFVKNGDGSADLMPILHLLKTQIYQLAEYLEIPQAIIQRKPTTDTYPAEVTQEEFFFRIPFGIMDKIWLESERGAGSAELASALNLEESQVQRVIEDIAQKQRATTVLRMPPLEYGR
ncbi:MAG TPA: NAD(+) synthase [bacterium]|nr:NAD(+) synthase [bacterium]HQG44477.1 NAD(+) synthase [bacterium]HQI47417.1 NAD(+) synthase [bacterium]HQJ63831.1 NAD(+) synthase [bacterium]